MYSIAFALEFNSAFERKDEISDFSSDLLEELTYILEVIFIPY